MDIPQVYLFTGENFVSNANKFLSDRDVRAHLAGGKLDIKTSETHIAIVARVSWLQVEEVWRIFLTYEAK